MKYQDSKNTRTNKYRKYKLSDNEKDIILNALQNRIDYLIGSIMLLKEYPDTNNQLPILYEQLNETEKVKELLNK